MGVRKTRLIVKYPFWDWIKINLQNWFTGKLYYTPRVRLATEDIALDEISCACIEDILTGNIQVTYREWGE